MKSSEFFIGDELIAQLSDYSEDTLIEKILNLAVIPCRTRPSYPLQEKETWLCLQREMLFARKSELYQRGIKVIGTMQVIDCVILYLTNGEDCVLAHVDGTYSFADGLPKVVEQFNSKDNIRAFLAGGGEGEGYRSRDHILVITEVLHELAQQFNCCIKIHKQLLWEEYDLIERDEDQILFDYLIKKVKMTYKQLFKKPFPNEQLQGISIKSFENNIWPENDNAISFYNNLLVFIRVMNDKEVMEEIRSSAKNNHINLSEHEFLSMLKYFFSKKGKSFFDETLKKELDSLDISKNFAFSIENDEVVFIDPDFINSIPYSTYRNVLMLDDDTPNCLVVHLDKLLLPKLSEAFLNKCRLIENIIKSHEVENLEAFQLRVQMNFVLISGVENFLYLFIQSEDFSIAELVAHPKNLKVISREARSLLWENKFGEALTEYKKILKALDVIQGDHVAEYGNCYSDMVSCYRGLGLLQEAMEYAEKAIAIFAITRLSLANMLSKYRIIIKKMIAEKNYSVELLCQRGFNLFHQGQYIAAIELFLMAADKFMENHDQENLALTYSYLAFCYRSIHHIPEAIYYANKALELPQKERVTDNNEVLNSLNKAWNDLKQQTKIDSFRYSNL